MLTSDNKDAPFTRRWKFISDKLSTTYADVVNGHAGVGIAGGPAAQPASAAPPPPFRVPSQTAQPVATFRRPAITPAPPPATSSVSAFPTSSTGGSAFQTKGGAFAPGGAGSSGSAFATSKSAFASGSTFGPQANGKPSVSAFDFKAGAGSASPFPPAKKDEPKAAEPLPVTPPTKGIPDFFKTGPAPSESTTPAAPPPPKLDFFAKKDAEPSKAPAPLFSQPGIFDTTPKPSSALDAGPSKSAIPEFFSSSPVLVMTAPASGSMFSSTLPSRQPTPPPEPSPPRTPPKPVIPSIKVSRTYMRSLPSILAAEMMSEVVAALVKDNETELLKIVRQRGAAADYRRSKAEHAALVRRRAREILSELVEEHVRSQLFAQWFHDLRARVIANMIAREWRAWTKRRVEAREREARQREQDRQHLKSIGLARSYGYLDGTSRVTSRSRSARSGAPSIITLPERVDEVETNFRETEEMRRKFWESDSSLFKAIAGHVAPLIRPAANEASPLWETVLLTAGQSGLPAGHGASEWLSSKLLTPQRGPRVLDGVYYHGEAGFQSCATDVQGFFPGSSYTGLYIFEAPLITLNTSERVRNMDDASDRLEAASGAIQQGSRYRTGLLILTWETETLEEVVQRLGIERDIEQFEHVAAVSINNPESFGALFAQALRVVVPSDPRKSQVVLPLHSESDTDSAANNQPSQTGCTRTTRSYWASHPTYSKSSPPRRAWSRAPCEQRTSSCRPCRAPSKSR